MPQVSFPEFAAGEKKCCAYIFVQFKVSAEVLLFVDDCFHATDDCSYCLSYVCAVYVGFLSAIIIKRLDRRN